MPLVLPAHAVVGVPYTVPLVSGLSGDLSSVQGVIHVDSSNGGIALGALCAAAGADVVCRTLDGTTVIPSQWDNVDLTGGVLTGDLRVTLPNVRKSMDSDDFMLTVEPSPNTPSWTPEDVWNITGPHFPLQEDPTGSVGDCIDDSGNGFDGNSMGSMSSGGSGVIGKCWMFDGSNDAVIFPDWTVVGDFIVATTLRSTSDGGILGKYTATDPQLRIGQTTDKMSSFDGSNNPQSSMLGVAQTTFSRIAFRRTGSTIEFFQNGVSYGTGTFTGSAIFNLIGAFFGPSFLNLLQGEIDDLLGDNSAWSDDQILWDARNTADPAATIVAGTPVYPSAPVTSLWEADSPVLSNNDPVTSWVASGSGIEVETGNGSVIYKTNISPTGKPALYFNESSDLATADPILMSLLAGDTEGTVVMCLKPLSGGSDHRCVYQCDSSGGSTNILEGFVDYESILFHDHGNPFGTGRQFISSPANFLDHNHIVTFRRGGNSDPNDGLIRVDRTDVLNGNAQFASPLDSTQSAVLRIGSDGFRFFKGYMYVMYIANYALEDADLYDLEDDIFDEWLNGTPPTPTIFSRRSAGRSRTGARQLAGAC